ncbi:MAG: hypothetical protein HY677_03040 [Chloroflexi bacterium]|nr:hypothetical protein [Chloroflexota bacterium]
MAQTSPRMIGFTEADLDFVVSEAAPGAQNPERLKQLIREDGEFRRALIGDEKVFRRVRTDDEIFVKISPALYFEVLLRRTLKELETARYTVERAGKQNIPVFDAREVVDLLSRQGVLEYLAQMLTSFVRINNYVVPVRVRRGVQRRVRYNDIDIDSLIAFCSRAAEGQRFAFYKRIADVCLFVSGVFPEYAFRRYGHPSAEHVRYLPLGRLRRSLEDYEEEGRRFYGLAEKHPAARALELSDVFSALRRDFTSARKPLSFIAAHYLHSRKQRLFGQSE